MTAEEFQAYDQRYPQIWFWFCHYAEEAWRRGIRRMSQDHIMHEVRRKQKMRVKNASVAGYARKYIEMFPSRAGFFVFKPSMIDAGRPSSPQMEMFG